MVCIRREHTVRRRLETKRGVERVRKERVPEGEPRGCFDDVNWRCTLWLRRRGIAISESFASQQPVYRTNAAIRAERLDRFIAEEDARKCGAAQEGGAR